MENSYILNFFITHWVDIVIVVSFILLLLISKKLIVKYDKTDKVKNIITALCIEAEKYLGSETGKLKKKQVITWFRTRYVVLSLFVSEKTLDSLIDNIVDGINEYLTDNKTTLVGIDTNINITKADLVK